MRVGLTLSGDLLNDDGAKFAAQIGATYIVVHLTNYARKADLTPYLNGGVGPVGAGHAYTIGYMRALVGRAEAVDAARRIAA